MRLYRRQKRSRTHRGCGQLPRGRRLLSALSCPSGSVPWGPGSGRIMWAPGKVAGDHVPLPQPLQGVDLRLSLASFSFTFLLAGVGTPRLESTRGKPQLIGSLCLDCSRRLSLCILHPSARTRWRYRMGGGSAAGGGGSTVEFFPKAYAPGPSQLWLYTATLLQLRARPPRPLDQDFNTQWHCTQCFPFCPAILLRGSLLHPPLAE